jgi:hypothetical protein
MLSHETKKKLMTKLYFYSKKRLRKLILHDRKVDTKCHNCNQWDSLVELEYGPSELFETSYGYGVTCANCKDTTYFNIDLAPIPIRCDPNGTPIQ